MEEEEKSLFVVPIINCSARKRKRKNQELSYTLTQKGIEAAKKKGGGEDCCRSSTTRAAAAAAAVGSLFLKVA